MNVFGKYSTFSKGNNASLVPKFADQKWEQRMDGICRTKGGGTSVIEMLTHLKSLYMAKYATDDHNSLHN